MKRSFAAEQRIVRHPRKLQLPDQVKRQHVSFPKLGVGLALPLCYHNRRCESGIGMWLSLVERCVRDAEVAGSNPVIPTILHGQARETGPFSCLDARARPWHGESVSAGVCFSSKGLARVTVMVQFPPLTFEVV
jgi:hypothetical protein